SGYLRAATGCERQALIRALRPLAEDYARVFHPDAAERARTAYAPLWEEPPLWPLRADQSELRVVAATVEELRASTGAAAEFPGGYADVIRYYRPGCILLCWEFLAPGSSGGLAFDGLVSLELRWAWFPKPWRVLGGAQAGAAGRWAE